MCQFFLVNPTIVCQPSNAQWKEVNMTNNKCFNYNQISFFSLNPLPTKHSWYIFHYEPNVNHNM